jgi:hypothetical protein
MPRGILLQQVVHGCDDATKAWDKVTVISQEAEDRPELAYVTRVRKGFYGCYFSLIHRDAVLPNNIVAEIFHNIGSKHRLIGMNFEVGTLKSQQYLAYMINVFLKGIGCD